MEDSKNVKVTFAPGCFDSFEGTQEELDEFVAEITKMFESPEKMMEMSRSLDLEELEEEDPELVETLLRRLDSIENNLRKLQ